MVVVVLPLAGLAILGTWFVLFALVGRSSFPSRERLPLNHWRLADLRANAARGVSELTAFGSALTGDRLNRTSTRATREAD